MQALPLAPMPTSLPTPILHTTLGQRQPDFTGKVRDIYDLGDRLIVDRHRPHLRLRLRARLRHPRQGQGADADLDVLVRAPAVDRPEPPLSTQPADYPVEARGDAAMVEGRSMLVRKASPLPIECVARGYLSGSGWKDYTATGSVCGIRLPTGLQESARLPQPLFTPATKAQSGHDINISAADAAALVGADVLARVRELTLRPLSGGCRARRILRHHRGRHEVRIRHPARVPRHRARARSTGSSSSTKR